MQNELFSNVSVWISLIRYSNLIISNIWFGSGLFFNAISEVENIFQTLTFNCQRVMAVQRTSNASVSDVVAGEAGFNDSY